MSPLDSFWNGVLSLLTPLVTPDWGKLIALIPWLLLLLVLAYLALIARSWTRQLASEPVRGPKVRKPDLRPMVIGHAAVLLVGVGIVALAFVVGAQAPGWTGATSPFGLVVNLPLLLLGLALAIATVGSAIRLWDRSGRDDVAPDPLDKAIALVRRHPGRTKRIVAFVIGVVLSATGLLLGTVPGWTPAAATAAAAAGQWPEVTSPDPAPVAFLPVLLIGLALAVGAVGSGIAAMWRQRSGSDDPSDMQTAALVPSRH